MSRPIQPSERARVSILNNRARSILTMASGFMSRYKFTLNPYGGCAFGCEYCYAKSFAPSPEKRDSWGQWVVAKTNAEELAAQACRSGTLRNGDAVYMSSATDPYQPVERRLELTRSVLETILDCGVQPRLTVQTRSPLVVRDIDLFKRIERVRVHLTITTDSEEIRRRYEPQCPPIAARLRAAAELSAAGIRIGVSVSPMLPLKDAVSFGSQLADLEAEEYVTQFMKPARSRFAAGTNTDSLRKIHEDGWGPRQYRHARKSLQRCLGDSRTLLEGAEGYAPA